MRNRASPAEYLAFLSIKYEVDPDKFFDALVSTAEKGYSKCGNLLVERRDVQKNNVVFLITRDSKVVTQLSVNKAFLSEQNNPIKNAGKNGVFQKYLNKKNRVPQSVQIRDLRIGMKSVSLKAEVVEIAKPSLVFTRFGNYASVANALISDETGEIKLCLWNEQIGSVSVGDIVQVENASISTFRGEKQLRIGKKGILRNTRDERHQLEVPNT